MNRDIKKIVSYYKRKTGTADPFDIADQLGILYQICNLQFDGCYMFLKNHRYIFINENLPDHEMRLVKRKLNKWTHIHFYGILFP